MNLLERGNGSGRAYETLLLSSQGWHISVRYVLSHARCGGACRVVNIHIYCQRNPSWHICSPTRGRLIRHPQSIQGEKEKGILQFQTAQCSSIKGANSEVAFGIGGKGWGIASLGECGRSRVDDNGGTSLSIGLAQRL